MESINKLLAEIADLKTELITQNADYELSKVPICIDLLKQILDRYRALVNISRFECNVGDFQKYHQLHVNLLTTVSQIEMQSNALLNKSISLIE